MYILLRSGSVGPSLGSRTLTRGSRLQYICMSQRWLGRFLTLERGDETVDIEKKEGARRKLKKIEKGC